MSVTQTIHVSVDQYKLPAAVHAVQNDSGRIIKMVVDDLTLTSSMTGKLSFRRPSGTYYELAATLDLASNSFSAEMDQALTSPGTTHCQLKVTSSGDLVSSFDFDIFVEEDRSGVVTPEEGISISEAVEAAESAADRAESAAETLELDATLTSPTKAAQAKAVGDEIGKLRNQTTVLTDDICKYIGKANVFDFIPFATFQNAYLNNNTPAELVASNNQLISNVFDVGIGTKLSIKVPTGYRIYVQYLADSGAKDGGTGFYTADAELTITKRLVAFSITKNPYSSSDNISPSEANGFNVYRTVTVDTDNLDSRITELETATESGIHFVRNLTDENIDTLKDPGYYYVTLNGSQHIAGTLPPSIKMEDGTNGFLTVEAYYNFVTQTLVQFLTGKTFVRGANTSASLVFNPWIEISNPEQEPQKIKSRNLWEFGDVTGTGYKMYGTAGTALFPTGKYTISFMLSCDETYINFNVYGSGGTLVTKQIRPSTDRIIVQIDATSQIERFFFQTASGSSSTYGFDVSDIQIEKIWWSGYEYSNTDNWIPLPYTTEYVEHEILPEDALKEYKSNWEGKTFLFNGDSITQGIFIDGVGSKIGYVRTATELLKPGKMYNYAVGGTRLAHVQGESYCLVDRLNDMATDADIVFIMCNTNDYASQVPLGAEDSSDTSTFNGALNTVFNWLRTNYAQKTVIISTPLTRKINYAQDGVTPLPITPEQYVEAVRNRVNAYHFVLFDAYAWSGMDLRTSPTDGTGITNDGLHPNQYGAGLLGRKVAAFINVQ